MLYRCPVDDVVFNSKKVDDMPTLEGHPECPGPACQAERDKGSKGAFANVIGEAAKVTPINAPAVVSSAPGASSSAMSVLAPPPRGQGW